MTPDQWADSDEWPPPVYSGDSKVAATYHPATDATQAARDNETVWRDRGNIIATLTAENERLRALVARIEVLHRRVDYPFVPALMFEGNIVSEARAAFSECSCNRYWPCPTAKALAAGPTPPACTCRGMDEKPGCSHDPR